MRREIIGPLIHRNETVTKIGEPRVEVIFTLFITVGATYTALISRRLGSNALYKIYITISSI